VVFTPPDIDGETLSRLSISLMIPVGSRVSPSLR